jgi:hypothetical protein
MVAAIAACGVAAWLLAWRNLPARHPQSEPAPGE